MLKVLIVILLIGIGTSTASRVKINDVKLDLCPLCINEAVEAINVILNVILDEGILQSCGELCGIAANKSHSKFLGEVCEAACDAFGLDEFIHLIITADLDPIWYCEMADLCPINDNGDATYTNFGVYPNIGPENTKFILDCSFKTTNGTGTSMLRVYIIDAKNETSSNDFLVESKKPGSYPEKIEFDSGLGPGTYNVTAQLCNGECDSHHPHSGTYAVGKTQFTVTKKKDI